MKMKKKKQSEELALVHLRALEQRAQRVADTKAQKRLVEMNAYERGPYAGDEELDGSSDYVSSEFYNVVEAMLPDLIDIFISTKNICELLPRRPKDEESARMATKAVNYVFQQHNDAFLEVYTAIKNGLQFSDAAFYWYKEELTFNDREAFSGVDDEAMQMIERTPDDLGGTREIVDAKRVSPEGAEVELFDIEVITKRTEERIRIEALAPAELLIHDQHRSPSLKDSPYTCVKRRMTLSEIREMGYPKVTLADLKEDEEDVQDQQLTPVSGNANETDMLIDMAPDDDDEAARDETIATGLVRFEFVRYDYDGDGIAELRRIVRLGNKILDNDPTDQVPISYASPHLRQHTWNGYSLYDAVHDAQKFKTELMREIRDSLGYANAPRLKALRDKNGNTYGNPYDMADHGHGAIIRIDDNPMGTAAVDQMNHAFVGGQALPFVEIVEGETENRLGITRYNQGLDADSLNKTATGMMAIMSASQRKQKLVARIFAELLFRPMVEGVLMLLTDGPMAPIVAQIDDEFMTMDPATFTKDYDFVVNVGLGTGNKQEQTALLQQMFGIALQLQQSPLGVELTDPQRLYNMLEEITTNGGWRNSERFWKNPGSTQAKQEREQRQIQAQQNPPPPPPEVLMKQAELASREKLEQIKADAALKDKADARAEAAEQRAFDLEMAKIEARKEIGVERARQRAETQRKILELGSAGKQAALNRKAEQDRAAQEKEDKKNEQSETSGT